MLMPITHHHRGDPDQMTYLLSISFTWEHYYKASLITGVVSLLVLHMDWFSAELKGNTYFLWTVYFRW